MPLNSFSKQDHVQITSLGIEFATAVLTGGAIGFWLDKTWGTLPWLLLAGTLAGFSLGLYLICRAAQAIGQKTSCSKVKKENGRS
jgi:F0F1-type ATP synthase assembly protein I